MFTGIIEAVGQVRRVGAAPRADGMTAAHRLEVAVPELLAEVALGASVAVNGICLSVTGRDAAGGAFDVIPETWRNTTLQHLRPGEPVNLERSLRVGDRLEGHFVQGHVDGVGVVDEVARGGDEWKIRVCVNADLMPYLIRKGSVAIDGTSLTIVDVDAARARFSVALIPTTLAGTVLAKRRAGDRVNIETDMLARLIVARLDALQHGGHEAAGRERLSLETLRAGGYLG